MPDHDPVRFAASLSTKLAPRSRHVCVFLGAGAATACGLPDMDRLQHRILALLSDEDRTAFDHQLATRNVEQGLTRLRRISALVSGEEKVDNLTSQRAAALDRTVCHAIVQTLSTSSIDMTPANRLAAWAARTNYHLPLELFTVNYDLLLETALENMRAPYFDGFIGVLQGKFHTELVDALLGADAESIPAFFIRLWKLHGSVNWAWTSNDRIVRLGHPVPQDLPAAIYPSDAKYEESRRVPFVVLQDRLRRALHQPETLMLITGYSFCDDHLNEQIFDAATRRERSEFVAFCFSDIPESLALRAAITPNLQALSRDEAIIGGVKAAWKAPNDPPHEIWHDNAFQLCDFRNLTTYLARGAINHYEHNSPLLQELLGEVFPTAHAPDRG